MGIDGGRLFCRHAADDHKQYTSFRVSILASNQINKSTSLKSTTNKLTYDMPNEEVQKDKMMILMIMEQQ